MHINLAQKKNKKSPDVETSKLLENHLKSHSWKRSPRKTSKLKGDPHSLSTRINLLKSLSERTPPVGIICATFAISGRMFSPLPLSSLFARVLATEKVSRRAFSSIPVILSWRVHWNGLRTESPDKEIVESYQLSGVVPKSMAIPFAESPFFSMYCLNIWILESLPIMFILSSESMGEFSWAD